MSLPTTIPPVILDTILRRLTQLFLTGAADDPIAARHAAAHMLAAYHTETEEELTLAAEIVSFRLHTLEALSYAADPDLSLNKILRLRGGAVSLSREAHKSQRKLDQLQRDRRAGLPAQPPKTQTEAAPSPKIDQALGVIEAARQATPEPSKKITWSQSYQKRQLAQRIAENAKKNQARHAHLNATTPSIQSAAPADSGGV